MPPLPGDDSLVTLDGHADFRIIHFGENLSSGQCDSAAREIWADTKFSRCNTLPHLAPLEGSLKGAFELSGSATLFEMQPQIMLSSSSRRVKWRQPPGKSNVIFPGAFPSPSQSLICANSGLVTSGRMASGLDDKITRPRKCFAWTFRKAQPRSCQSAYP